eukprot:3851409-Rhodomonas_salina.1
MTITAPRRRLREVGFGLREVGFGLQPACAESRLRAWVGCFRARWRVGVGGFGIHCGIKHRFRDKLRNQTQVSG